MTRRGCTLLVMGTGVTEQVRRLVSVSGSEALPELTPWREVGWIFRDGSCVAIERRGNQTRERVMGD